MKYYKLLPFVLFLFVIATLPGSYLTENQQEVIEVSTLSEFKKYLDKGHVNVKLAAGNDQIDDAKKIRFMEFTGNNTHNHVVQTE